MDFFDKLKTIFSDKGLRNRILFILGALFISRMLAAIPIPGINSAKLITFFSGNDFLSFLNVFSGGGMSKLSIVMLGVGPYITSSIIMQLLTIPIALIQGFSFLKLLQSSGVITQIGVFDFSLNLLIIVAGSMLMMWIGELMTEFGIGNGTSLLIFAGIVSRLPTSITQMSLTFSISQIPMYALLAVVFLAVIYGVVYISEAERPVPVTYAKRITGSKVSGGVSTYLPLRLNQAGVIPIIFGMSILLFPQMIFKYLSQIATNDVIKNISSALNNFLTNSWAHGILYFVLVVLFTYFYTAVTFDPDQISKNLQQGGAFIPGVRPGTSTSEYLARVLTRITLVGALFLGVIAVLPLIVQSASGISSVAVGGTALLIVVSVVIDLIKKIQAQITMREY